MLKLAKGVTLLAAFLPAQVVQAADPASQIEPGAVAPGSPEPNAPPAPDGAKLFGTHCAMGHKPADLVPRVRSAPDRETARAAMATFLARHGRSDAAADAAIMDWLMNGSTR